jgi:hypothetical protein
MAAVFKALYQGVPAPVFRAGYAECASLQLWSRREQAIAQLSRLPDADQEQIGRRLLSHVEKLNAIPGEIDKGFGSLDAGEGSTLNIEDFLREKNSRHGEA